MNLSFLTGLTHHRHSPIVTTTIQAVLINSVANIIAQFLEIKHSRSISTPVDPKPISVDVFRVLQFVTWTLLSVPPHFRWQQYLERTFPAYYEGRSFKSEEEGVPVVVTRKRNFRNIFKKILCDQGCAAPINCALFLLIMTLLRGGSFQEGIETIHNRFWALKLAGWRIWPLVGLFNYSFVPVDRRVIVSTIVGLCWNVFLALFITK